MDSICEKISTYNVYNIISKDFKPFIKYIKACLL